MTENYKDTVKAVQLSRRAWALKRQLDATRAEAMEVLDRLSDEDLDRVHVTLGTTEVLP